MNSLSLMLYLASVVNGMLAVVLVFFIITLLGTVITGCICFFSDYSKDREETLPLFKRFLPICLFAALLVVLIPSKETMYIIIASEAGEEVVQSETGKKAIEAVNRYLDSVGKDESND